MRLVIDANVAQSAGSSEVPSSYYSRECLNAVLDREHVAVFNQMLREEWRQHASRFARVWWRSMTARKRIQTAEGNIYARHLDPACACLEHDKGRDAMRKDFHLVQAALASDRTILSNEKEFPLYLALACRTIRELSVYYANPATEGSPCIVWIKAGAQADRSRRIDIWVEDHLGS